MQTEIKWNDRYNIGVNSIDQAHQKLFSIVRKMVELKDSEKDRQWVCTEGIKYFQNYAQKHFADEEGYMKFINYEGYEAHKRLHDGMRDKTLPALEKDMIESGYSAESVQHFLGICIGWLTGHIMLEDHAITGRVKNKWIHEPTEETAILEELIAKVMNEVFCMELDVVSEHYAGEDFGKKICYRLTYRDAENKRIQVFFVLEERLVLHTVGQLMNVEFKKMDQVVDDAARTIAEHYMKRVAMYYNSAGVYTHEKTNMLTEEQLTQDFGAEYPKYSLLFNTGEGYMAVCIKLE
ncbi:MAG: hypothetical protein HDR00_09110 [Lachnospiraceae bacterium]|nr:hypothetical protein [Lachnospiraceae bacterium]